MSETGLDKQILSLLKDVFCHYPQIKRVTLFGSRAKGCAKSYSDIDLAVFGVIDMIELERMAEQLDLLPLPYQFDVKAFETIQNRTLREHIERVGIDIYP